MFLRQLPEAGLLDKVQERSPLAFPQRQRPGIEVMPRKTPGSQVPSPTSLAVQVDGEGVPKFVGVYQPKSGLTTFREFQHEQFSEPLHDYYGFPFFFRRCCDFLPGR